MSSVFFWVNPQATCNNKSIQKYLRTDNNQASFENDYKLIFYIKHQKLNLLLLVAFVQFLPKCVASSLINWQANEAMITLWLMHLSFTNSTNRKLNNKWQTTRHSKKGSNNSANDYSDTSFLNNLFAKLQLHNPNIYFLV